MPSEIAGSIPRSDTTRGPAAPPSAPVAEPPTVIYTSESVTESQASEIGFIFVPLAKSFALSVFCSQRLDSDIHFDVYFMRKVYCSCSGAAVTGVEGGIKDLQDSMEALRSNESAARENMLKLNLKEAQDRLRYLLHVSVNSTQFVPSFYCCLRTFPAFIENN